ncbi:MAG TPA: SufS family cysteine desulfurase [Roseiflexaceae bacterium]|nr:SufS family cysteine desulfurase [Roseiflexaceae bacterium]
MIADCSAVAPAETLDIARIRQDFPALQQLVHGQRLVFLDSAASSQKPAQVLDAMEQVYRSTYANVHRGAYSFSQRSTDLYEQARAKIAAFIGAESPAQIVFTRNATEALNLLAYSYGRTRLRAGDEIVLTELEHHANYLPWLQLARERGVVVKQIPLTADGTLDLAALDTLLTPRVRLISFAHVSNVLGTITDPRPIVERAHALGAVVALDACQSAPHMPLDVRELGADFLVFSGHKMLGPTGIGVLYGRADLLAAMPPFMTGGDVARDVGLDDVTWEDAPLKFEAGTPAFVEAIGLGAAVDYLQQIGMAAVRAHERELVAYALDRLSGIPGMRIFGPSDPELRGGVVTFTVEGIAPQDLALALDQRGIAIRSGRHCAHPLHQRLGLSSTARASFTIHNDLGDVDALVDGIAAIQAALPSGSSACAGQPTRIDCAA